MYNRKFGTLAVGFLAASTLAACGPDEKNGDPVEVTHQSVSESISDNSLTIASSLSASLAMLEQSDIFRAGIDATVTSDTPTTDCVDFNDPANCEATPTEPEPIALDATVDEGSQAMVDFLSTSIFVDGNIETEATTEITYLLRGDVVCESFASTSTSGSGSTVVNGSTGPEPSGDVVVEENTECIEAVDAAEIRLRVTAPAPGDVDVAILVGPQRFNPASFEFHQDQLAAEIDFAGAKGAVEHIAASLGEDAPELPTVMAGRVRGALKANGPESVTTTFSVLTPVDIQHPDFSLQVASSTPASELTIDGANKQLLALSNLGVTDLAFAVESIDFMIDEFGNETEVVERTDYEVHLGGATGQVIFDLNSETVAATGLGLGNGTTTVAVNGQQVLGLDVNPNDGRTFDLGVQTAGTDDIQLTVSPLFHLQAAMTFENMADYEGASWTMNDTMTILFDGDANPALIIGENGLEVLRGNLSMGLANEGSLLEVSAGQCLIEVGQEPTPVDPGTEPVEPVESAPFDGLEVGTCG